MNDGKTGVFKKKVALFRNLSIQQQLIGGFETFLETPDIELPPK